VANEDQKPKSISVMRSRARRAQRQSFGNRPYRAPCDPRRATPCVADFSIRARSTVGGGRRAAPV